MKHICSIDEISQKERELLISDSTKQKLREVADFFKVLGDRTRLTIVSCIAFGEKNVCTIAELSNATHSLVSHHLSTLRKLKIVDYHKHGKCVVYKLVDEKLKSFLQKQLSGGDIL